MANYTKAQLRRFDKLAREAAGMPEVKSLGDLAREHQVAIVEQIKSLATQCPLPEVRLAASKTMIELAKVDPNEEFGGDPEALQGLLDAPNEQKRVVALKLFANGDLTKRDLDVVLKVLDSDQTAQLATLLAQNQKLEKALIDASERGVIEGDTSARPTKAKDLTKLAVYQASPSAGMN
ncbi:MAG: hypothetical protein ABIK36_16240 [Pseudomonadota bacterium]